MNFYFQEYPVSDDKRDVVLTKIDHAYARLEDLFIFLKLPKRSNLSLVRKYFTHDIYPKKSFLLKSSEVSNKIFFVAKGAVRGYTKKGKEEHSLLILTEGNLITCFDGFFNHSLSNLNIATLEESIILSISYSNFQAMLREMPEAWIVFNNALCKKVLFQQKMAELLRSTTKDKFNFLQHDLHQIYSRFQLKYLASFIGIKPETLSRIRSANTFVMNSAEDNG